MLTYGMPHAQFIEQGKSVFLLSEAVRPYFVIRLTMCIYNTPQH